MVFSDNDIKIKQIFQDEESLGPPIPPPRTSAER